MRGISGVVMIVCAAAVFVGGCQEAEVQAEVDRTAAVQSHRIEVYRQLRSLPLAGNADGELADAQPESGSLPEEVVVAVDGEQRRVLREREPVIGTADVVGYIWGHDGDLFFELAPELATRMTRAPEVFDYLLYIDDRFVAAGATARLPEDRQWLVVPPHGVTAEQLREWFPPGPDDPMIKAGGA